MDHDQTQQPGSFSTWVHWAVIVGGSLAILWLLYAYVDTLQMHVMKAKEVSRDAQWKAHAPVGDSASTGLLLARER